MVNFNNKTITLTWGCQAENHVGMIKEGDEISKNGFTKKELKNIKKIYTEKGFTCKVYNLHNELTNQCDEESIDKAYVLVIKNGITLFTDPDNIFMTLDNLDWDKKYYDIRRQCVLNKRARYNLIFGEKHKKADFNNKQGTVYNINEYSNLKDLKLGLSIFGENFKDLECEGNNYYDISKCGIGYHGDTERKKVIGMRFGETLPLYYWWYLQSKRIGKRIEIPLDHGDIYIMSERASGFDWKKRKKHVLRHATGCIKYIT